MYLRQERCIQGFGGETRGKETTWKIWHRWEYASKIDLKEVGWTGMDWITMVWDRDR